MTKLSLHIHTSIGMVSQVSYVGIAIDLVSSTCNAHTITWKGQSSYVSLDIRQRQVNELHHCDRTTPNKYHSNG